MLVEKIIAWQRPIILLHKSVEERLDYLVRNYKEGFEQNKLCIYATPDCPEKAIDDFNAYGFDIQQAVANGSFKVFDMQQTYLPHGTFAVDFMLNNVEQFIEDAAKQGFNGTHTAGEMSWLYDQPDLWYEAIHYEGSINELQDCYPSFTGLCLYPTGKSTFIEDLALRIHPLKMECSTVIPNKEYICT